MQVRILLAGLAAGTLAISANAAIVSATITPVSGNPASGTALGAGGVAFLQDGLGYADNGFAGSYVTNGSGADYIASGTQVVLSYDFGGTVTVSSFMAGLYGHPGGTGTAHANSATQYTIDLGTTAGGSDIASGIIVNVAIVNTTDPKLLSLGGTYNAAFATVRVTDNGYNSGAGAGGDRVGFSEASFHHDVPEPGSLALIGLGALAFIRRRR